METREEDKSKREQRDETGGDGDGCLLPKPKVLLWICPFSIGGEAGCWSYGCFRTIREHTHTHTETQQGSQRVWRLADLKTALTASCTGGRASTWVAEAEK